MKKLVILLLIVAAAGSIYYYQKQNDPGPDLEVEYYMRKILVPDWTPLGRLDDPEFLELRPDRYYILIVSVPARVFRSLDPETHIQIQNPTKEDEYWIHNQKPYPNFTLYLENGQGLKPKRITAWPRKSFNKPLNFDNQNGWYPTDKDKSNERFHIGMLWKLTEKKSFGDLKIQMGDNEPIPIENTKYEPTPWEELTL
ncbi:MAG: hypothetical protein JW860_13510 [Sedimentisphaerales bacterium]|nr:hypothetical protein [Sedimentisphaerales bacterium]